MKVEPILGRRSQMMMSFERAQGGSERAPTSLVVNGHPIVRRVRELEPVLYDSSSCKYVDPELAVYTVYRTLWADDDERSILQKHGLRYDVTDMPPLTLGEEYVKTFGHEHLPCGGVWSHPELFEILEGKACFLVQRYRGEEVVDVSLVAAGEGDVVLVPPSCGHVMINASSNRLIAGNLISRYCSQTYQRFVDRKGGAYFLLKGERLVRNENYPSLPEVRIVNATPLSFVDKESGLLASFGRHPELFKFLNNQWDLPQHSRSE